MEISYEFPGVVILPVTPLGNTTQKTQKSKHIHNENNPIFGTGDDADGRYYDRYNKFYKAISAKYPDIVFIGNGAWNGTGWDNAYKTDVIDVHVYESPEWFIENYTQFDNADRNAPKFYLGEFAVTKDKRADGTEYAPMHLRAALAEAVYMCGLERNSGVVTMQSFAPIFQNDDMPGWWPTEMIHFNNHSTLFMPSYHVQKLFPKYLGEYNVEIAGDSDAADNGLYTSANISTDRKTIFLRLVNPGASPFAVNLKLDGSEVSNISGEILSGGAEDVNTWENPENVKPVAIGDVYIDGGAIQYNVPAYSAVFMTISLKDAAVEAAEYIDVDLSGGKTLSGATSQSGNIVSIGADGVHAWDLPAVDAKDFRYLVIVPEQPYLSSQPEFIFGLHNGDRSFSDWDISHSFWNRRRAIVVDLEDKTMYDSNTSMNVMLKEGAPLDFSEILVSPLTHLSLKGGFGAQGSLAIAAVCFTNHLPTYHHYWNFLESDVTMPLTRDDKTEYSTICYPWPCAVCGAEVYDVVGVDDPEVPSKVYLERIYGVIEAGRPCVIRKNVSAEEVGEADWDLMGAITVYRLGDRAVSNPMQNGALAGAFKAVAPESGTLCLSDDVWKSAPLDGSISANAWLTGNSLSTIDEAEASDRNLISMKAESGPISGVDASVMESEENPIYYNLQGLRVAPQKGEILIEVRGSKIRKIVF